MKRSQLILRMGLGGIACGSLAGIFVGALLGIIYGTLAGDISFGLDGALLGCGGGAFVGCLLGVALGFKEKSTTPRELASMTQKDTGDLRSPWSGAPETTSYPG